MVLGTWHFTMVRPSLAVILALVFLAREGDATVDDFCTDISYYDVPKYETSTKQCCNTELKQVCNSKAELVCRDVPEIQCNLVTWPECELTNTKIESKKCRVKYQDYTQITCTDVQSSITHTKKVPVCRDVTKENCVSEWNIDANGVKVWAGTETCTPVTWEECEIVEKQVEFPIVRTECGTGSVIKWVDFVEETKTITGINSNCHIKSSVDCNAVAVKKCVTVNWKECSLKPVEECQPVLVHGPLQEKVHRKKCLISNTPGEKKVVIPCGFNDDLLAPKFLPNGQKSPHDTSKVFQWKNNIVPYYFSNDDYRNEKRKAEDRKFVRGVMDKFEETTCFKFVEKSKNQLRMEKIGNKLEVNEHVLEINIQDDSCALGNEGSVFPVSGTTRLQLYLATHVTGKYPDGSKCRNEGLVIHELMHAFGVGHTHRRRDRDTFIQVIFDNLNKEDPRVYDQYEICEKCVLHKEIHYECGSIMHYGSHDNSEDFDKAVIVPLDEEKCKLPTKALQVYDASDMDWQLINIIGECSKLKGQASPANVQSSPANVQSSPVNYPEKLANVDRVFRGYDIMKGNPLPLKEILLDPGLRQPIFEATYHDDSKTPDHRYLQPDGVDILNCADSCSIIFKTEQFSGAKSYQQSLSNEVGFSLGASSGAYGAKFSASVGFREVSEKTSSESKLYTMSAATCCAYRAELRYVPPSLSKSFLQALEDLTEKYNEKIYLRFIEAYGTHFISRATMGSKFIHLKEISKETVSTLRQNGVDIKAAAEVSAYAVTAAVDTSSTNDVSKTNSFSSESDTQNTYTIGVKSPEDGKALTWIQKPLTNPAPIQLELMEIVNLLDLHKDIKVSAAVKANLQKAMKDYCGVFLKLGRVSTCSAPGPDPSIPTNVVCKADETNSEDCHCWSVSREKVETCTANQRCTKEGTCLNMCKPGKINSAECFCKSVDGQSEVCAANRKCSYRGTCESDRLFTGQHLNAGDFLRSPNGEYDFVMQGDGNMVIYRTHNDGRRQATWESQTYQDRGENSVLRLQYDGNLVLYNDGAKWYTDTYGNPDADHLVMQDDGNLVLYTRTRKALWNSKGY